MIPNEEKEGWHYLAVKTLSGLLHRKNSKHNCDFCCLNCLEQKIILNLMKKYVRTKISVELQCQQKRKKMLEFNQYMKLDKIPYIIYADIESWIRKIDGFAINPEQFSTMKLGENISCEYSMSNI